MLHIKGRQSSSKGFYSVTFILLSVCFLLVSCIQNGFRELTEAEQSAFGEYVNQMDSTLTGVWFDRMGVSADADSVFSYLSREVPRNGLDTAAFFIPAIAKDLEIVHKLAFDSVGVSINDLLPRLDANLTKAYVRFATGQRYGFMRPRVFNRMDPKVGNPGTFARVFDYDVAAPDTTEAAKKVKENDRVSYLIESAPDTYIYKALLKEMDKTTDAEKRHQIAVNMERCRWQIPHPKANQRQILVNIAAQQLFTFLRKNNCSSVNGNKSLISEILKVLRDFKECFGIAALHELRQFKLICILEISKILHRAVQLDTDRLHPGDSECLQITRCCGLKLRLCDEFTSFFCDPDDFLVEINRQFAVRYRLIEFIHDRLLDLRVRNILNQLDRHGSSVLEITQIGHLTSENKIACGFGGCCAR